MTKDQLLKGAELANQIAQMEQHLKMWAKPVIKGKQSKPTMLVSYMGLYGNFIDMDAYREKANLHLQGLKKQLAKL